MPVSYRIERNVVFVQPQGVHSTDELREAWLRAERDPAYPKLPALPLVCVDVRESESLAKRAVSDMRATVGWFIDRVQQSGRVCAFVARPGIQYGLVRMMSAWLDLQGYRTFVTTDPAEAMRWLHRIETTE